MVNPRKFTGYMLLGIGISNLVNASEGFFPAVVGFLFIVVGAFSLSIREED